MNTPMKLLLPFASTLLLAAATVAQQDESKLQDFWLSTAMLVRPPGLGEQMLKDLFGSVSMLDVTTKTVLAAYNLDERQLRAGDRSVSIGLITPQQAIVYFNCAVRAATAPPQTDAAAAAIARMFQQKLSELLYEPAAADLTQQLERAQQQQQGTEDELARAAERLAALGGDELQAQQQALTSLQQKLLDAELELRTETGVQQRLQAQMQQAQAEHQQLARRTEDGERTVSDTVARLNALSGQPEATRAKDFAEQLARVQDQIRRLQAERDENQAARERATSLYNAAAEQLTTSTLSLQRHLSRKQVLDELIARQTKAVDEGAHRASERERLQREADAARAAADAARTRVLELRRQREQLQPVQVVPWK